MFSDHLANQIQGWTNCSSDMVGTRSTTIWASQPVETTGCEDSVQVSPLGEPLWCPNGISPVVFPPTHHRTQKNTADVLDCRSKDDKPPKTGQGSSWKLVPPSALSDGTERSPRPINNTQFSNLSNCHYPTYTPMNSSAAAALWQPN